MSPRSRAASVEDFQRRNIAWMHRKILNQAILTEDKLNQETRENTFRPSINKMSQIIHKQKLEMIKQ
jgi:hypothetical protein